MNNRSTQNTHGGSPQSLLKRSKVSLVHLLVIGLSLIMTIGAWLFTNGQLELQTEKRFEQARDSALGLITERIKKYEDALWAGAAAVESHGGDISYQDWKTFAHTLRIDEKYPGINGIGVIHFLTGDEVSAYLSERHAERPEFTIRPAHDNPNLMPISFIEPESSNAAAVGLDVAHELNRRTAALATRDTGKSHITGPIVLVQDAGHTPGFLFYVPFYRGGAPEQISAVKPPIAGSVYAPFVVQKLMAGLLAKDLRNVRFSITDAGEMIYNEHTATDPRLDPNPMFSEIVSIDVYGRTWTLDIQTDLAFRQANTSTQPMIILIAGLLIEGLIIGMLALMARAVRHADEMSATLREKSAKLAEYNRSLAEKNEEIEQFAYITSHDLKTPIRGIGGLTEMIQEDLEDYFASPGANLEVRENLERIQDRVDRMRELTRGVMEISQVANLTETKPLMMPEAIRTLSEDFDLVPGQLTLTGDVTSVDIDAFNFRRVLENLVGNAIKYHHDPDTLKITVNALTIGDRCKVSIKDNGPGIDPIYHDRIFDIFQTLRTSDAVESTGIGLAIVKKAVSHNNGSVSLTSTLGDGATFMFDWPLRATNDLQIISAKAA